MVRMIQKRDANGASVLVPAATISPVTCAAYIGMRAKAMQSEGHSYWPSYSEFVLLYGVNKAHAVADLMDYVSVFGGTRHV